MCIENVCRSGNVAVKKFAINCTMEMFAIYTIVQWKRLPSIQVCSGNVCLLYKCAVETFVFYTSVQWKRLSSIQVCSGNVCLLYKYAVGNVYLLYKCAMESFAFYTGVQWKPLPSIQVCSGNVCLLYKCAVETFAFHRFSQSESPCLINRSWANYTVPISVGKIHFH